MGGNGENKRALEIHTRFQECIQELITFMTSLSGQGRKSSRKWHWGAQRGPRCPPGMRSPGSVTKEAQGDGKANSQQAAATPRPPKLLVHGWDSNTSQDHRQYQQEGMKRREHKKWVMSTICPPIHPSVHLQSTLFNDLRNRCLCLLTHAKLLITRCHILLQL